jgi:ubiquinone/menaquinone biosynthesis C-methylase UbiE
MPTDASAQAPLVSTGERLMTDNRSHNLAEHLHRYAIACQFAKGRTILDIASGEGYGANLLASQAAFVYGVDVAGDAVAHAAGKYQRANLRFQQGTAIAIPLEDAAVDIVVSFETIEHLREHDEMMAEIRRVLRPDGMLIMSSPNKRNYSDLTGHANAFHLRELYSEEFRALIGRFFSHACFLLQRISYGSFVTPEIPTAGFIEYRGDFNAVNSHIGLQQAVYNIAIASDQPVPDMPSSLWNADSIYDELRSEHDRAQSRLEALQQQCLRKGWLGSLLERIFR